VHDWGGLALAMRPQVLSRLDRLVVMDIVPVGVPGYRWHRIARVWRTPVLGELAMGFTNRWVFKQSSREGWVSGGPMPDHFLESVSDHFDQGTMRAILRLYRSAPSEVVAGSTDLARITCPALVLWGVQDPYIPARRFGSAMAEALAGPAELELVDEAGHWPWLDRPELIPRVAAFLGAGRAPGA
jgi:pimeloyl-ACP methyl ester carboxylesterase